ncbi:MAG: cytochrome P450 [Pseudomonadales bacterium]
MTEAETLPHVADEAWSMPLADIDVSRPELFMTDSHWDYFRRLRKEDPVHYCATSPFGPYWSITRFRDIMAIEANHEDFSSADGIVLADRPADFQTTNFISMDPPKHDVQRKTVQGVVAPMNLAKLEATIRERAARILDAVPVGEEFNWVDRVSIELTTQMLATIFDFPFEERRKLTYWSDMATSGELAGGPTPEPVRRAALLECLEYFTKLRDERINEAPKPDLLSMLAHGKDTRDMPPMEFLGNLILLIVGGNDTTRNSISGGVLALNENPAEYDKLRNGVAQGDITLIPNMVSEIIRWQTPLAYMRRTAKRDVEFGGKTFRQGDKIAMWYVSGNRDEEVIPDPDRFWIDRPNARHHLSFGFGVHRCMGNRLAEMQLRVLWEEIMKRFRMIEITGPIERVQSSFVKGYASMPVRVHPW